MPSSVEGSFTGMPRVTVNGQRLAAEAMNLLEQVIVDDHLHMPDSCTLILRDPDRSVLANDRFKIGADLKLEVSRRLKEDWDNGRDYYALHGRELWLPMAVGERPRAEYLAWHREERWLG